MSTLLEELEKEWKKIPEYKDVKAEYWKPNQPREKMCPRGCSLQIWEEWPKLPKWERISCYDAYRQTRHCREHGFARIYVITGPTAQAHNWNPGKE